MSRARLKTESQTRERHEKYRLSVLPTIYLFDLPTSPSHGQFLLAKFWWKLLTSCQVKFPTSHSRCSLLWWSHCLLACPVFLSLAKASQHSFKLTRQENCCGERFSFVRTTKSLFLEGQPTLVMFHLFIVGATNILSELIIQPLFKLLNCPLKQQPHILQFIICSTWLGFLPLWGAGTGFVGILPLLLILELPENTIYIAHRNNAQDWIQHSTQDLKPLGVSNLQRGWSCE